jgi:hypothetical protein
MYVVSWNLQIRIYVGYLKLSSKNTYSDYSWWQHRLCKIICIACYRLNLELLYEEVDSGKRPELQSYDVGDRCFVCSNQTKECNAL